MFYWTQEIQNGIMSQWVNKCKILKVDFPGGPVVENLPCNSGEEDLIPSWGTKMSYACHN